MAGKTEIKAQKAEIIKKFGASSANTGSTEVQIALITHRINTLTDHFKTFAKDHSGRRGLLKLVGQRRRLLDFLKQTNLKSYSKLLESLELRK